MTMMEMNSKRAREWRIDERYCMSEMRYFFISICTRFHIFYFIFVCWSDRQSPKAEIYQKIAPRVCIDCITALPIDVWELLQYCNALECDIPSDDESNYTLYQKHYLSFEGEKSCMEKKSVSVWRQNVIDQQRKKEPRVKRELSLPHNMKKNIPCAHSSSRNKTMNHTRDHRCWLSPELRWVASGKLYGISSNFIIFLSLFGY